MPSSILEQAKKQFAKGNYQQVISLLEPHVTQYVVSGDTKDVLYNASFNKSFPFYLYLGLACLHTGDIGGAVDYLACARKIKLTDPDLLCAQAVLFLRRGDTVRAIDYYLEAIEYNPNHELARSGLEFIRTHNTPEAIGEAVQSGEIKKFYPRPGVQSYIKKRAILFAGFAAAVLIAVIAVPVLLKFPLSLRIRNNNRADLSALTLLSDEKARPIDTSGSYRYTLSEKEVLAAYRNAQKYFQDSRDNLAQIEVNRILSSNAAHSIKQKARLLMDYFSTPGFDTVRDIPVYSDVRADIPLYVQSNGENTSFDLLVGYDDRIQLEGVVPIFCNFSIRIDSERPIEVLGKIQQRGGVLFLKASGIHQSQVPANKK